MFAMYRSALPEGRTSKTTLPLSGDQLGVPTGGPLKELNCTGFEVSRSHTQISGSPERRDWKAICLESGEIRCPMSPRVELMIFVAGRFALKWLFISICQILLG